MAVYNVGGVHVDFRTPGAPHTWDEGGPPPVTTHRVFVFGTESNSDGQGLVSELPLALRSSTNRVRILIPSTGQFADMHLGVNNNEDHEGLTASMHGPEAGLLPYQDAHPEEPRPFYVIQIGQGGSWLALWENGSTYWNKANARIQAAKTYFTANGISVQWDFGLFMGINDFIAGTPISPTEYGTRMQTLISDVRGMIGVGTATRVRSPKFMPYIQSTYPSYCAVHEALPLSVANMQLTETSDLTTDDIYHWDSASQVINGQRIAALT